MIVVANPLGDFRLNDDWVYARAVKLLLETDRFEIPSFSSANIGPQILWGAVASLPFSVSFEALRASTLILAFIGLASP